VGVSYHTQGELAKGLEYKEKALKIREAILPPNHPNLAGSYNNVGGAYKAKGDLAKAKAYIQKAVAIAQAVLPSDHPERLRYENNLKELF
jgi:tetratricopeptide (TPR) repeat protein